VRLVKYGDANTVELEVVEQVAPVPGPGKVVVRMTTRSVDPADVFSVMGIYPGFAPASLPAVPGLDGMGKVHAVGEGVKAVAVGQRVVPMFIYGPQYARAGQGSYQDYVVFEEEALFPVPDAVPDEAACQFVVNPFTAWLMIKALDIPKGEYLIQSAAGSALGQQVIQMCKHLGIKTINVVRRKAQIDELKAIGADEVLTTDEDVVTRVKEITQGKGAYGGIDAVAGGTTKTVMNSLRQGGVVLIYGMMDGVTCVGDVIDLIFRDVTVRGFWVTVELVKLGVPKLHEVANEIWELFEKKVVVPSVGQIFDLAKAKEALQASLTPARKGKVLLTS